MLNVRNMKLKEMILCKMPIKYKCVTNRGSLSAGPKLLGGVTALANGFNWQCNDVFKG